jgi:hypothetical protein
MQTNKRGNTKFYFREKWSEDCLEIWQNRSEKQGDMLKCWTFTWHCTTCSFWGLLCGWSNLCLLKLSIMHYHVSRPLFGFWGREFLHVRGLSYRLSACCYYFESENERVRGETDISDSVKLQDGVFLSAVLVVTVTNGLKGAFYKETN